MVQSVVPAKLPDHEVETCWALKSKPRPKPAWFLLLRLRSAFLGREGSRACSWHQLESVTERLAANDLRGLGMSFAEAMTFLMQSAMEWLMSSRTLAEAVTVVDRPSHLVDRHDVLDCENVADKIRHEGQSGESGAEATGHGTIDPGHRVISTYGCDIVSTLPYRARNMQLGESYRMSLES
jgi:hypothetical protein